MSTQSDSTPSGLQVPRRPPMSNDLKPCFLWLKGSCRFGERCKYSHGKQQSASTNNNPRSGLRVREGSNAGYSRFEAQTRKNEANRSRGNMNPNENANAEFETDSFPQAIQIQYWIHRQKKLRFSQPFRRLQSKEFVVIGRQADVAGAIVVVFAMMMPRSLNICAAQPDLPQSQAGVSGAIIDEVSQQGSTSRRQRGRQQRNLPAEKLKRAEENRKRKEIAALAAKRAREEREQRLAQEKAVRDAQEAAARQSKLQLEDRRKREALVTEQDVVLGSSLITYGAGLDVRNVITGFDLCRVTIKNLPRNAKKEEIADIFTQQGIERSSFFIKDNGNRQEATVLMNAEEGQAIAAGLQGIECGDRLLTFEVSGEAGGNTMGSSAQNSDCLTIYWRVPSQAFVVTYLSMDEARKKMSELDRTIYKGERIRAQMNQPPPGRLISYVESSIKLSGFPIGTFPDHDLASFSGSHQIRALTSPSCGLEASHNILLRHLRLCQNIKIETYQNLTPNPVDGNVRVKVQFEAWEDAKKAYESINDKKLHNSPIFHASLPSPLEYTIIIPKQQYEAQKKQWDSLSEKTPDRDAHVQTKVGDRGDIFIRVLGQDKKAVGSLKVRVEHMVAGERLAPEFWHPSFLAPNRKVLFDRIYRTVGVYVKSDLKTRSLKVYGGSDAVVEEARMMIKEEVDRLAKLETTELLDQASVGFFVRGGLRKLQELLGEENATMSFGWRGWHITIKGGEEGRHHLNQLIAESRIGDFVDQTLPGDIEKETCPVCTDEISHPEQLGCGHTYCSGCLRRYLESAPHTKIFPIVCIGDEDACKTPISIPQIRRFLQPQVFQALVEVAFRSYLDQHAQELKFCTTPDCQQIYRHSPSTRILQCPSCFSTICSACDEEAHEGMTCQERRLHKNPAEQDCLFNEWANVHGKRCPECRSVVEKNGGCNHMTCHCGAHFCWTCGQTFGSGEIYDHMNTAHGGMYDGAPVWANPNNANVEGNIMEEQARLLAQARRQQEIQALRQQNALRVQVMENRRRELEEDAARRQQNALHIQMVENRRRQLEEDAARRRQNALYVQAVEDRRRQLQNDADAALRQQNLRAQKNDQKRDDSGGCYKLHNITKEIYNYALYIEPQLQYPRWQGVVYRAKLIPSSYNV
ncbi:hypothetical protein BYT27DRAFT_7242544 [Phlegmacium glaucopus]|nr:hypothetical protein BYT27DRAFT_7242544 [Phlegmacium glaucopus]